MVKDIFGNEITHDIYGNPLKKENKRERVSSAQKKAILIEQGGRCANPKCRKILTGSIQYDHIKEVYRGGKSTTDNLRAFCGSCHDERHILDKAKEMDKKRRNNNSSDSGNYWINPLTGKREKINSLWSL